jgi:hypothetical protein
MFGVTLLRHLWLLAFGERVVYRYAVDPAGPDLAASAAAALDAAELSLSAAVLDLKVAEAERRGHVLKARAAAARAAHAAADAAAAVAVAEAAAASAQCELVEAMAAQSAATDDANLSAVPPTTVAATPAATRPAARATLMQPLAANAATAVAVADAFEPTRGHARRDRVVATLAWPFLSGGRSGGPGGGGRVPATRPRGPLAVSEAAATERWRAGPKENFPQSWPKGLSGVLCSVLD